MPAYLRFVRSGTSGYGAQHGGFQPDLRQRELQGAGHATADPLPTGVLAYTHTHKLCVA